MNYEKKINSLEWLMDDLHQFDNVIRVELFKEHSDSGLWQCIVYFNNDLVVTEHASTPEKAIHSMKNKLSVVR